MAASNKHYPDYLNPFGSDDEEDQDSRAEGQTVKIKHDDYPEYLSPFEDDINDTSEPIGDYDDSLNPFGDDKEDHERDAGNKTPTSDSKELSRVKHEGNPFEEDEETPEHLDKIDTNALEDTNGSLTKSSSPQPESLDPPPVPLPRTKSLLKKEKAQKNELDKNSKIASPVDLSSATTSIISNTSSTSSSSFTATKAATSTTKSTTIQDDSIQRRKNKRNAPPVPVNYKRQVSGSLDAIEEELNNIGDNLAEIEKEYNLCQDELKASYQVDEVRFAKSHLEFSDLIRRKNSILRRQKELMYNKRELKLDQIHSDIEYELRMIGNKQLSHKTPEDEAREKDLLKKLVEIVEEKSDIVENLNKDTSSDSLDIEEALRRLNIACERPEDSSISTPATRESNLPLKKNNFDKSNAVIGTKLSKIATLLPRGSESRVIKGQEITSQSDPFNVLDTKPDEVACFCNGVFYQSCPPSQSGCIIRKKPVEHIPPVPYEFHDSKHPDHVEILEPGMERSPLSSYEPWSSRNAPFTRDYNKQAVLNSDDLDDNKPVVLHRKVYVSERLKEEDPVIHPIELTIPVDIKHLGDAIPPPKPVYKLRKYTTYETRPEIEMVPVTTTVIKPVGVTQDQIIGYKKY